MTSKITQGEFISRCILAHGYKYTYYNAIYDGFGKNVIITCLKHGDFLIFPEEHWRGVGCKKCDTDYKNKIIDNFFIENNYKIKRCSDYITSRNNIDLLCLHCNTAWSKKINYCDLKSIKCRKCNGPNLTNERIDKYLIDNNKQMIRLGNYDKSYIAIDWRCLICDHIWSRKPVQITRKRDGGAGCPQCLKITNKDMDKFFINKNISIKRLGECENTKIKINWQCLICEYIWTASTDNIRSGCGCPECWRVTSSKNEGIVRTFLKDNNIEIQDLIVKLPISKTFAEPDFYIPSMNLVIEYNGKQHYEPVRFGGISIERALENFEYQQVRDRQMREYCENKGFIFKEIDGRKYKNFKLINYLYEYFKINKNKFT